MKVFSGKCGVSTHYQESQQKASVINHMHICRLQLDCFQKMNRMYFVGDSAVFVHKSRQENGSLIEVFSPSFLNLSRRLSQLRPAALLCHLPSSLHSVTSRIAFAGHLTFSIWCQKKHHFGSISDEIAKSLCSEFAFELLPSSSLHNQEKS